MSHRKRTPAQAAYWQQVVAKQPREPQKLTRPKRPADLGMILASIVERGRRAA